MPVATSQIQIKVDYGTGELALKKARSFEKWRSMRLDPTINLARKYSIAPILKCPWTVKCEDAEIKANIEQQFLPIRMHLMTTLLHGENDFGWKAYEKIFDYTPDGFLVIDRIKPLKNDNTRVRYNRETGRFLGLANTGLYDGRKYIIDADHSLFCSFDSEGIGAYGTGAMEIAEQAYDRWNDSDKAANKYDKKVAGAFWMLEYPEGVSQVNGQDVDNSVTADLLLNSLEAGGSMSVPVKVSEMLDELNTKGVSGWKLTLVESHGGQAGFGEREKYLDVLKIRAFDITERAVLEGQYGTKAEAGVHANATLVNLMLKFEWWTQWINWHYVNQISMQNWGVENYVTLVAEPIADDDLAMFQALFTSMIADPALGPGLMDLIDQSALVKSLHLPVRETDDAKPDTLFGDPSSDDTESTPENQKETLVSQQEDASEAVSTANPGGAPFLTSTV